MFKSRSTLFELLYLDLPAIRETNGPGSTDTSTMAPSALLDNAALPALSAPGYTHTRDRMEGEALACANSDICTHASCPRRKP